MQTAIRHLESDAPLAALERLLELWPRHHCAALAVQIDRLGAHLDRSVKRIPKQRQHASWLERFSNRQPADLVALMAAIEAGTSKNMKAKVDTLLELPPDPRTTPKLLDWAQHLQSASFGPWGKVWTAVLKVAVHVGDPRMADGLKAIRAECIRLDTLVGQNVRKTLIARLDRAIPKFPEPSPIDVTALSAALDTVCAGKPPGAKRVYAKTETVSENIQTSIYDDPDDDGPISIWADLLQEADDDLGTLIMLHLQAEQKPLSAKDHTLERRLRKTHTNRLLGPLSPVVDPKSVEFRRGLLTAAKVNFKTKELKNNLKDHPNWRALRQIQTEAGHLRSGALPNVRRFGMRLIETPLVHLDGPLGFRRRAVAAPSWKHFGELAQGRKTLPLTAFCVAIPPSAPTARDVGAFDDPRALPDLAELHLHDPVWNRYNTRGDRLGVLWDHPLLKAVDRLVLEDINQNRHTPNAKVYALFERVRGPGQTLVVLSQQPFAYTLTHDDAGLHAHVSTTFGDGAVAATVLRELVDPQAFASFTLRGPTIHGNDLDVLAEAFSACSSVVLPRRKRGT